MDNETEKRLITELSISTDMLIDTKNLTGTDKIDTAINTLEKIENRINRKMLFLIIGCSISILLLFIPDINTGYIGSFLKGALTAMMFIAIMSVKQIRHIYDKEIFILKLLKESQEK